MAFTAWDRDLGVSQGRIAPAIPIEGGYLFALGAEKANVREVLRADDYVEVSQTGTFAARVVRFRARTIFRAPPAGASWELSVRIGGTPILVIAVDASGLLADQAVPTTPGAGTISFRLTLRGVASTDYEVELPAVLIDALIEDASPASPGIYARRPEPEETGVAASTNIALRLTDFRASATGIDPAQTSVYVDGILAVSNGSFQAGFTGPGSSWTLSQPTLRIVIDPTTNLASQANPTIRVLSKTLTDGLPLDVSYDFTVADTTPPRLLNAVAMDHRVIRFLFNEAMTADSAASASSATNPANYAFVRPTGVAAVAVSAVSVAQVSDVAFDVTTNWELTPGATYTATVTNATDLLGNAIGAPTNVALVDGYVCPAPEGRRWQIADWIPDMNWSEDQAKDLERFVSIIQEITDIQLCEIDRFTDVIDPNVAPIAFVEAMLNDLGNPFAFALSDIDKRRLAQVLVTIYRQKGTGRGIVNAVRFFLGLEVLIEARGRGGLGLGDVEIGVDWILGSGAPRDWFALTIVSPITLTQDQRDKILAIANYMRAMVEWITGIEEPTAPPPLPDHLELGLSELGISWILH